MALTLLRVEALQVDVVFVGGALAAMLLELQGKRQCINLWLRGSRLKPLLQELKPFAQRNT